MRWVTAGFVGSPLAVALAGCGGTPKPDGTATPAGTGHPPSLVARMLPQDTNGGPGGATDTLTNFIYREGIEKTNVGYATAMSQVFLIVIIIFVTLVLNPVGRWVRDVT